MSENEMANLFVCGLTLDEKREFKSICALGEVSMSRVVVNYIKDVCSGVIQIENVHREKVKCQ